MVDELITSLITLAGDSSGQCRWARVRMYDEYVQSICAFNGLGKNRAVAVAQRCLNCVHATARHSSLVSAVLCTQIPRRVCGDQRGRSPPSPWSTVLDRALPPPLIPTMLSLLPRPIGPFEAHSPISFPTPSVYPVVFPRSSVPRQLLLASAPCSSHLTSPCLSPPGFILSAELYQ